MLNISDANMTGLSSLNPEKTALRGNLYQFYMCSPPVGDALV